MREIIVTKEEEGQTMIRFLMRYLNAAPSSFCYQMLRRKNIVRNGKKADGKEILFAGDSIRLFLSDETIEKFQKKEPQVLSREEILQISPAPAILYEDENVLFLNKPAGWLTQKASPSDISLNDWLLAKMLQDQRLNEETAKRFRPACCNRLDRNTSGIVTAGKTKAGLSAMSALLQDRTVRKFYLALVAGQVKEPFDLSGYLKKDNSHNKVQISETKQKESVPIQTKGVPLFSNGRISLLSVELVTGRPHQIRAHLAAFGHPVIGDDKYGDVFFNREILKQYGVKRQLLHAERIDFPVVTGILSDLSGCSIKAPVPDDFKTVAEKEGGRHLPWQRGIPED